MKVTVLAAGSSAAGPLGLLIIVLIAIATVLLIRNMSGRLRRLPPSFPPPEEQPEQPEQAPAGEQPEQPEQPPAGEQPEQPERPEERSS